MAHSLVVTASGIVKDQSGLLHTVNVTVPATGAGVVRIWDNPSTNSGNKLFEGNGLTSQSFNMQSPGDSVKATQGLYCELAGTTNATVVVVYD